MEALRHEWEDRDWEVARRQSIRIAPVVFQRSTMRQRILTDGEHLECGRE